MSFRSRIGPMTARCRSTQRILTPSFRRSSSCGRPTERRTFLSFCSTTSASLRRAHSVVRARRRRPSVSPDRVSSTTASIRRRCALRPEPHSSPAGTTTRSGWASSPSSRPRRPGTTRFSRIPALRSRKTLRLNGYSTAQFGKCHEVPVWQSSPMGPVRRLADRRRWVRVLLRLHRRRDEPVLPRDLRRHDGGGAREDS